MVRPTTTPPETDEELVPHDDRLIGKVFRWSLALLVAMAAVVAVIVYLLSRQPERAPVREDRFLPPSKQDEVGAPPDVHFTDVTAAAGLAFRHDNGARGEKLLPETMGPGCAFFDYDNDGDQDILLVNGRSWSPGEERASTLALYANDGAGRFTDVTRDAGLAISIYGMGVAVGDYDGDGRIDVFVSSVHADLLLRNVDGVRFEDVTTRAGVAGAPDAFGSSCAFADFDGDRDLDLFVCNYVEWSPEIDRAVDYRLTGIGRAYGPPTNFAGTQPYYYRNEGDGTFTEQAAAAGLHVLNPATGGPVAKSLGVLPLDHDADGDLDLFVANDTTRNFLYRNEGLGRFTEIGIEAGVAFDADGASTGAMGIDGGYYRNDRTLGVAIGNFATEMTSLYVSESSAGVFSDESITEGIGPASRRMLSFGVFFFDYDLDGRLDLFQTNGHIEEAIHQVQASQHYRQPSQLFWNCGPGHASSFVPVDTARTGDLGLPVVGRAAAYADIDGDGDLDVLLTQTADRAVLLRNDQQLGNHWLRVRLAGTRCCREAIGAWVEVDAGGVTQRQQLMPTRSYLSQVEAVLTFGLGQDERAPRVRVLWPGERVAQELGVLAVDAVHVIEQR